MTQPDLASAEAWFVAHGLPYFVDSVRDQVHAGLRRSRLVLVLGLALVLVVSGTATATLALDGVDAFGGLVIGINLALVWLTGYAFFTLKAMVIARWAARRTFSSLGLLFPLVTRALPLLLLFVTFLFLFIRYYKINISKLTASG